MIRNVVLHGIAAKRYGAKHEVDADTTYMLFRGLSHKLGVGFKKLIADNKWRILKNENKNVRKNALSEMQIHNVLDDIKTIHIVPVLEGSGAVFRVIVGAVLIAYGTFGQAYGGGPWATKLGMALVLGGVAQMIAPVPRASGLNQSLQMTSYNFSGPQNNVQQGGPVPLVYGKVGNVGGTVISLGLTYQKN
jgi:predicted phage tail protein